MKKKILITGCSGYIGSHLCKMIGDDYELYGIDKKDPTIKITNFCKFDINTTDKWPYQDIEFDAVIHLAAETAVGQSVKTPTIYYQTNIFGTLNILKNIKSKNIVVASTGAAVNPKSPYGMSKKAMEEIIFEHCNSESNFVIFRFFNVVGTEVILPNAMDGLMRKLIEAKETGKFNLYGTDYDTPDGTCIRDFVHVNEICNALKDAINSPTNTIESLGHGVGTSVKDIISIFKKVNNCDFEVINSNRRDGDIVVSVLDNPSKFMKKLYDIKELFRISNNV
jgi:UDP-glucose 4-epimerase